MPDPENRVEYRGTGFYLGLVAILLFALALLVLAVQNTQEVDVAFFGFVFTVPLFAVAIGAVIIAVVLDELIGLVWRRQKRIRLEERAELDRLRAAEARPVEEGGRVEEGSPAGMETESPIRDPRAANGEDQSERADDQEDTPSEDTPSP